VRPAWVGCRRVEAKLRPAVGDEAMLLRSWRYAVVAIEDMFGID
jgi:hypothetical protein